MRVYYEDTDAGGVVFYANYLKFMERARSEWLRAIGFDQLALSRDFSVLFVVRSLEIDYLKPGRFDDMLQISVELVAAQGSRIEVLQNVSRGEELLATARVKVVCVNTRLFKAARIPDAVMEKLQ